MFLNIERYESFLIHIYSMYTNYVSAETNAVLSSEIQSIPTETELKK